MTREPHSAAGDPAAHTAERPGPRVLDRSRRLRRFALVVLALVLAFGVPLGEWVRFAATSEFHSYLVLIPFLSLYLVWLKRRSFSYLGPPARLAAGTLLGSGLALVVVYWLLLRPGIKLVEDDYLALMTTAFLLCFLGVCCLFWDRTALRMARFPLGLLIFMVPIPSFAMPPIDSFLQKGSAAFAQIFFSLSGTPFLRDDGMAFQLPNITLQIAPECSGIQSSLVLLISGLVAAYLFLRTPWKRAILILFVVLLGLIRNGFRVFVIGELCVHFGPNMIHSYIHHNGGPIFFVLSLIPLFLLLVVLQRSETNRRKGTSKTPETKHA